VARGGHEDDAGLARLVDQDGVALDDLGEPGVDDGGDAVVEDGAVHVAVAGFRRGLPVLVLFSAEEVLGVGEGGLPATLGLHGIKTDVVHVHVCAHHHVYGLPRKALHARRVA